MLAAAGVFVGLNNRQEDEYSYFVSQMTFILHKENNMEAPKYTKKNGETNGRGKGGRENN